MGLPGAGPGQFDQLKDVATDCRGGIWTSDGENDRVLRFAEPGTLPAPCPTNPGDQSPGDPSVLAQATPAGVSNPPPTLARIRIRGQKLNLQKGTATLRVEVSGPGRLALTGKGVKRVQKSVAVAGEVVIPVSPRDKAKRSLQDEGKTTVRVVVTFMPSGGEPVTTKRSLALKKRGR